MSGVGTDVLCFDLVAVLVTGGQGQATVLVLRVFKPFCIFYQGEVTAVDAVVDVIHHGVPIYAYRVPVHQQVGVDKGDPLACRGAWLGAAYGLDLAGVGRSRNDDHFAVHDDWVAFVIHLIGGGTVVEGQRSTTGGLEDRNVELVLLAVALAGALTRRDCNRKRARPCRIIPPRDDGGTFVHLAALGGGPVRLPSAGHDVCDLELGGDRV